MKKFVWAIFAFLISLGIDFTPLKGSLSLTVKELVFAAKINASEKKRGLPGYDDCSFLEGSCRDFPPEPKTNPSHLLE